MVDIFGREINDYDVVIFPFITRGNYMNSKVSVELSYGVTKGKRVYVLNSKEDVIYKVINSPETMLHRVPMDSLPTEAFNKIYKIKEFLGVA